MGALEKLYDSDKFNGLDPVEDKAKILKLADLDWEYRIQPFLYYDDNDNLIQSSQRVVLIKRGDKLEEVASRGKDFKCTSATSLYDVFLNLKDELGLSLHSLGHTREGKFIYVVCKMDDGRNSTADKLSLSKYLMIYAINDGNGKTKFAPLLLKEGDVEYQLSVLSMNNEGGRSKGEYVHTCYEISHHYRFDSTEATMMVKASIEAHLNDFENDLEVLSNIEVDDTSVEEFHHSLYERFNIGNEKTKRGYEKVMEDLQLNYEEFNKANTSTKDTLYGLYLSFVYYIDAAKKRKLGLAGRINSINFTHDNVTKRFAFKQIQLLAGKLLA